MVIIFGVIVGLFIGQTCYLTRQYRLLYAQYKDLFAMYERIEKKVYNF